MRRLAAFLLACLVPLQFAWAGAQSLHAHASGALAMGWHAHDDVHGHDHDVGEPSEADSEPGDATTGGADSHFHPPLSTAMIAAPLVVAAPAESSHAAAPPRPFASRTPPPTDRPPARG